MIPYGHQSIDDDDVAAVVGVLRSEWLTQGPEVTVLFPRTEESVIGDLRYLRNSGRQA